MKILAIGDLHGRRPVIKDRSFDCIVLVGDVCEDRSIAPLYKKFFKALKNSDDATLDFEEFASEFLNSKKRLEDYEKVSLKEGAKIMKYLDSFGKPIFMVAGNWDQSYGKSRIKDMNRSNYNYLKWFYDSWAGDKINPALIKGTKNVRNCMLHNQRFGGINFVGYGLSSASEKLNARVKRRKEKKQHVDGLSNKQIGMLQRAHDRIFDKLSRAHKKRNKRVPTFFITHNIPNGTKLDKITDKESYAFGKHLGSTIARKFCTKFRPMICVGGHIHDSPGKDKLGKTLLINPGYGKHAQVMIDFDEEKGKVKKVRFVK
jgi:Icc-related predicted phosphoesterase